MAEPATVILLDADVAELAPHAEADRRSGNVLPHSKDPFGLVLADFCRPHQPSAPIRVIRGQVPDMQCVNGYMLRLSVMFFVVGGGGVVVEVARLVQAVVELAVG